jgi:hypothetical protein
MFEKDYHIILDMRRQNIGQETAEYWSEDGRILENMNRE